MPTSSTPVVSVIIASYNHAQYLPECLNSILTQTYQDFEIVIVDDGSTDGSHELLLDYQRRYPDKVRYYWHPGRANKGISLTWNLGIEKSQGEYLAWLGSDDVWLPRKLEKQIAFLYNRPSIGMVYSSARVIDGCGVELPRIIGLPPPDNFFAHLLQGDFIPALTVMLRCACLQQVGFFNETLVYSDWELWIRIASKFQIGFISEPLALYRVHDRNVSVGVQPAILLKRGIAVFESVFSQLPEVDGSLRGKALAQLYLEAALASFVANEPESGYQYMIQTIQLLSTLSTYEPDMLVEQVVGYVTHSIQTYQWDFTRKVRFMRDVFSRTAPELERKAIAHLHIAQVFTSSEQGDSASVRHHILRAIMLESSWLHNLGLLSIGSQAFLGQQMAGKLRQLARYIRNGVFRRVCSYR